MGTFYEFFAGGGMARMGLGPAWKCTFSNDFDPKKADAYRMNFGVSRELHVGDVAKVTASKLPGMADLAWASFPCQDLSLAGNGAGLQGTRSGTFWAFWGLMRGLSEDCRRPRTIVIENVCGTLTSRGGEDFKAIAGAFSGLGYKFGAVVIDARHFLPQSRPRLFIIGIRDDVTIPDTLRMAGPGTWHPKAVVKVHGLLSAATQRNWVWWNLPQPSKRNTVFADLVDDHPKGVVWHTEEQTKAVLGMMSKLNRAKVDAAKKLKRRMVGGVYKRTRPNADGTKTQRAEIRFDNVAGCLRTPAGGSSRQTIMVVNGDAIRTRLLSPREAARLMGLPEEYKLPERYNDAYHLMGDGVVVPVVRFIRDCILDPILKQKPKQKRNTKKAA